MPRENALITITTKTRSSNTLDIKQERKEKKLEGEQKNRKVTDKIAEENSFQWHQTNADEKMSHLKKFSDYMHISLSS